jgi:hypothetical protein
MAKLVGKDNQACSESNVGVTTSIHNDSSKRNIVKKPGILSRLYSFIIKSGKKHQHAVVVTDKTPLIEKYNGNDSSSNDVTITINDTREMASLPVVRTSENSITNFSGLVLYTIAQYLGFKHRLKFSGLNEKSLYNTRHFAIHSMLHFRLREHLKSTVQLIIAKHKELGFTLDEAKNKANTLLCKVTLSPTTMREIERLRYKTTANIVIINNEESKTDALAEAIIQRNDPLYLLIQDTKSKDWQLERHIAENVKVDIALEKVDGLKQAIRENDADAIKQAIVAYENPLVKSIESHREVLQDLYRLFYYNDNSDQEIVRDNIATSFCDRVNPTAIYCSVIMGFVGGVAAAMVLNMVGLFSSEYIRERYFPSIGFPGKIYLAIACASFSIFCLLGAIIGGVSPGIQYAINRAANKAKIAKNKRQLKKTLSKYGKELLVISKGEEIPSPFNVDQVIKDLSFYNILSSKQGNINAFLRAYAYDRTEKQGWINWHAKGGYKYLPFNGKELIRSTNDYTLSRLLEKQYYSKLIFEHESNPTRLQEAFTEFTTKKQMKQQDPSKSKSKADLLELLQDLLIPVIADDVTNKIHQRVILLLAKHDNYVAKFFAINIIIKREHSHLITGLAYHSTQAKKIFGQRLGRMRCDDALSEDDLGIAKNLLTQITMDTKGKNSLPDKVGYYRDVNDNVFFKHGDALNHSGHSSHNLKLAM